MASSLILANNAGTWASGKDCFGSEEAFLVVVGCGGFVLLDLEDDSIWSGSAGTAKRGSEDACGFESLVES